MPWATSLGTKWSSDSDDRSAQLPNIGGEHRSPEGDNCNKTKSERDDGAASRVTRNYDGKSSNPSACTNTNEGVNKAGFLKFELKNNFKWFRL